MEFILTWFETPYQSMTATESSWLAVVIQVGLMWVLPTVILFFLIRGLVRKIHYLIVRQRCQHCNQWTTKFSTSTIEGTKKPCTEDRACCKTDRLWHRAYTEQVFICPQDGSIMDKVLIGKVIGNLCTECGATSSRRAGSNGSGRPPTGRVKMLMRTTS